MTSPATPTLIVEIERPGPVREVVLGIPGPPGPPGPAGAIGDAAGALLVANRLSEFATPEAKAAARQNLDLQNIDGGTFN